ncbi:acyltransferase [Methylococcus sp. Mc7]|uniref:acyltransferase n=1 Tax=Methylococcus sp. Mc7 TaxID=2860258 RepID=UPI001C52B54E|nr:acyltransferase [Methylococcus sp. Mc7]QXP83973.1 acyltransferase [Methylococcus sp. Mc7]
MSRTAKRFLLGLLTPAAAIANRLDSWHRLWAHARLKAALGSALDPSVVVLGTPELHGSRNIRLGRDLYLYPGLYLETQERGRIEIGDGVVLSRGVHIVSYASVVLEDGVMVGEYTSIRDANHRVAEGRSVRDTGHDAKAIRIGRNAWIGRGSVILRGVTVGEAAVIGANAVVTHDVPAGAVVAGVPARPIERARGG